MYTLLLEDEEKKDSYQDTMDHKNKVEIVCGILSDSLLSRGTIHDNSKLTGTEKEGYDNLTANLSDLKYGTQEYRDALKAAKPTIDHHYKENRHHPEHFENGINDMDLVDISEMFCDWVAACKRTKDGDILKSLKINKERFNTRRIVQYFRKYC